MLKTFALGSIFIMFLFNNLFGLACARSAQLKADHPAPGRIIDVVGYQLHIYCIGNGNPTVIMEAGLGNPGLAWILVQPEIAKHTRSVCTIERGLAGAIQVRMSAQRM